MPESSAPPFSRVARARTPGSSPASRSARALRRMRLLSTSDCSVSSSASQTVSAASRCSRLRTRAARRRGACSPGVEQVVAPRDRRPQRLAGVGSASRPAREQGRAAASAARGSPRGQHLRPAPPPARSRAGRLSSRRQISATYVVAARPSTRRARKRATASASVERRHGVLPLAPRWSRSRLVTRSFSVRAGSEQLAQRSGRLEQMLEVVEQEQQLRLPIVLGESSACAEHLSAAIASTSARRRASGASRTHKTPCG